MPVSHPSQNHKEARQHAARTHPPTHLEQKLDAVQGGGGCTCHCACCSTRHKHPASVAGSKQGVARSAQRAAHACSCGAPAALLQGGRITPGAVPQLAHGANGGCCLLLLLLLLRSCCHACCSSSPSCSDAAGGGGGRRRQGGVGHRPLRPLLLVQSVYQRRVERRRACWCCCRGSRRVVEGWRSSRAADALTMSSKVTQHCNERARRCAGPMTNVLADRAA